MKDIKKRIKELKKEIEYQKRKLKCCAYGKSDLMYLWALEEELVALEKQLEEMEG